MGTQSVFAHHNFIVITAGGKYPKTMGLLFLKKAPVIVLFLLTWEVFPHPCGILCVHFRASWKCPEYSDSVRCPGKVSFQCQCFVFMPQSSPFFPFPSKGAQCTIMRGFLCKQAKVCRKQNYWSRE